jgi:hypothetical protein
LTNIKLKEINKSILKAGEVKKYELRNEAPKGEESDQESLEKEEII